MAHQLWWLIHKDLIIEYRSRHAWLTMLMLGIVVAVVFSLQLDLPLSFRPRSTSVLLWLAVLFAGMVTIERTCAVEQADGCWRALRMYPLPPAILYLAKLLTNFLALLTLVAVLVPLFAVVADVPLLQAGGPLAVVAILASLGLASVGTLVSALTAGLRSQGTTLALLVVPLVVPILLAAGEATRLLSEPSGGGGWWRWAQFLALLAFVFTTVGGLLAGWIFEE